MAETTLAVGTQQDGFRFVGGDPASPASWEPLGLKIGTVDSGYRFMGGDPSAEESWEPYAESDKGGFMASAKQSIGATIKGAGQAAADYLPGVGQDNPLKRYGQEVIEANPTAVNSFEDMADKPLTAVTEATGNAAGSVGAIVGARALGMGITAAAPLTGPAAPVTAAIGQAIAWFGPAAIAALPSYGSIRDKQVLNDPAMEEDAKGKAIAAFGAGTVGLIETKFGPQQWALSALTKEGRAKLAEKFAETGILKGLGYGALKGGAIEGAEELAQNPVEQLAAFDNPLTPENLKETAFGGTMGAIGGGVLGGGTGTAVNLMPKASVTDVLDAPDVDSAIQAAGEVLALPAPGAINPGETILADERGTAGTAAQFDALRRPTDIRETGAMGLGRDSDVTDVTPRTAMQLAFEKAGVNVGSASELSPVVAGADGSGSAEPVVGVEAGIRATGTAGPAVDAGSMGEQPSGEPVSLGAGAGERLSELRQKWPGLAGQPDENVLAAEAWSNAERRLKGLLDWTPLASERVSAIEAEVIGEMGGEAGIRKAGQVPYLQRLTERLTAAADQVQAEQNDPRTLAGKRQEKKDAASREASAAAMQKATEQDIEFNLARVREIVKQGRVSEADAQRLLQLAQSSSDGFDAAMKLEGFVSDKEVPGRVGDVGQSGAQAANDPPAGRTGNGSDSALAAMAQDRSSRPADEIGRDGLRAEDRFRASVDSAAAELAMQVQNESAEEDFDPKEIPAAIKAWAKAANVPEDDLRIAFEKEVGRRTFRRKAGVLQAINPINQARPAEPTPRVSRNRDGTATVLHLGDKDATRLALKDAGITNYVPTADGYMVGKSQADKALKLFAAPQEKAAQPLAVGLSPGDAQPVSVRSGVVYIGKDEAIDFDSGEPVKAPEGASDAQIRKALTDAGSLSKRQKFFGGVKDAPEQPVASAKPEAEAVAAPEPESAPEPVKEAPSGRRGLINSSMSRGTTEPMASRKDVVGNNEGGRSADDETRGVKPLVTAPDRINGIGVPVRVVADPQEPGMRFEIDSDGNAILRIAPAFLRDKDFVRYRYFRAVEDFLWPYSRDTYIRSHDSKDDYDHLKAGTHRGSKNHATDEDEGGLSVARTVEPAGYDWAYFVTGKPIGQGGDSEPLLDMATVRVTSRRMDAAKLRKQLRDDIAKRAAEMGINARSLVALETSARLNFSNESPAPDSDGAQSSLSAEIPAPDGYSAVNDPSEAEAQEVQSGIEGKSAVDAAKFIAENAPDESHRLIASKVAIRLRQLELLGSNFNLHVAHVGQEVPATMVGAGIRGQVIQHDGDPETHIWIQGADVTGKVGVSYETVLHELVHAATQKAIDLGEHGAKGELGIAARELDSVWRAILRTIQANARAGKLTEFERQFGVGLNNAIENRHELVAWALTNKEAQAFLESVPYKSASAWSAFVAAIRRFLRLAPSADTALSEVLHVADKLLSIDAGYLMQEAFRQGVHMRVNFAGQRGIVNSSRSVITGQALPQTWQAPDESKLDNLIYSLQDKHIDTRRAVQAVRDSIGQIEDAQDPYLQEELFHGRAAMATKEFLEKSLRPLLTDMQARGIAMSDFEEYLHNRHAEKRNVQVAKVNPKMPDGGSGIKTADARAYLANLPAAKRQAYQALARRVDQINKDTRQLLVSSGLEKQSTIDAWQAAYGDEYVPLMREEMDNGATGIGQGFSVRGSSSKRAMGSDKPVANIIANIALQREKAITRAEKRRIGEALYGLVLKAPNDDFWFAVDPALQSDPKQVLATQMQLISMGMDPADAESIAKEPTTRYIGPDGKVHERINPAMRSADNVLAVRIDGEDKFVFFNAKDPRAMRMAQALKNLDADQLGAVMGNIAKMTRWFASVNTQFNPIFGVTNITRDVQGAMLNLNSTPLANHKAEVLKHVLPALRGIYIDLRDHRAGKQPSSVWAGLFEEFQREGGATGYRDMYANAGERADKIASELRALKDGAAMKLGKGIMGWLSDYNESMENAVRLAAYKVGKEQGLSNQQAASLAKNLTVNFNRKGQVALQAGALYAFFNASIQGSARLAQTMFDGKGLSGAGKRILSGGLLLGSMQALLLAAAGFDDDEPPDFVRERSLVLPIGGGKYVSIPMPLGFHVIPNLSRIPTEWAMSGFKNTPKRLGQLIGVFADAFNPVGSAGLSLQTLTPTIIDPLAALAENKDFTGKPIAKKDFDSMRPTAGHTRAKDTATPWAKVISWSVNAATGGTDYKPGLASPTPDQIDYLIGQVTGGVGREAGKLAQVATGTATGEEVPLHKIPLVGRFVGTTEGQSAEASRFYENLRQIGAHKVEIDGLRRDRKGSEIGAYLRENKEARLVPMADKIQREVSELNKRKRELIKKDAPRERVKLIDQQITAKMRILNTRVKALEN